MHVFASTRIVIAPQNHFTRAKQNHQRLVARSRTCAAYRGDGFDFPLQ